MREEHEGGPEIPHPNRSPQQQLRPVVGRARDQRRDHRCREGQHVDGSLYVPEDPEHADPRRAEVPASPEEGRLVWKLGQIGEPEVHGGAQEVDESVEEKDGRSGQIQGANHPTWKEVPRSGPVTLTGQNPHPIRS